MHALPNLRMGRIAYLNVLPIYYPLEAGILDHDFEIVSGPPALLNDMMAAGQLHVSSCSCFEYAKHPNDYYIIPNLSIGSYGPVMSVLLLSRVPIEQLDGQAILISDESQTSVALLRLLLQYNYGLKVHFITGMVTPSLRSNNPPIAFLAIGDEALRLRNHPSYPHAVDLAEAWQRWTGMPFIFGLWVASKNATEQGLFRTDPGELLRQGRDWGLAHMNVILDLTKLGCPLSREELQRYYHEGLTYNLAEKELQGLTLFYEKLANAGMIPIAPSLRFFNI